MDESGWVIERGDSEVSAPTYWAGFNSLIQPKWSQAHLDAIRFARRVDAEKISTVIQERGMALNRICEHGWGL